MALLDSLVIDAPYRIAFQATQTPAHLALVCAIAGVEWELRDDLQVADLGCGRGYVANTLAAANPGWHVVGIDHSPVQIAEAALTAKHAGLVNVEFIEADLGTLGDDDIASMPPFDVVMVHGLWTWVSDGVRAGIQRFLRTKVRPGGLVYVGYNALPAAGADFALQRLLHHLAGPWRRRGGSVAAAEFAMQELRGLAHTLPLPRTAMLERLLSDPPLLEPAFVAHEFLTGHWRPVFHEELCEALVPSKLEFIGSCNLFESLPGMLADPAANRLLEAAPAGVTREFLKDVCLPRTFRADVFARGTRRVDATGALDRLTVAASRSLPDQSPVLSSGAAMAALPQPLWDVLSARLAAGPCRIDELRRVEGGLPMHPAHLLAMLSGAGLVLPVFHNNTAGRTAASAARFNHVVAGMHAPDVAALGHFALASERAAGGLPADAFDLALVSALTRGAAVDDTAALALALQPRAAPEQQTKLAGHIADRLSERLPVWRRFGVL